MFSQPFCIAYAEIIWLVMRLMSKYSGQVISLAFVLISIGPLVEKYPYNQRSSGSPSRFRHSVSTNQRADQQTPPANQRSHQQNPQQWRRAWSPWVCDSMSTRNQAQIPQYDSTRFLDGQLTVTRVKSTGWLRGRRKCYSFCVEWITFTYQVGEI